MNSALELGYKQVTDVNGDEYLGFVIGQNTIDHGTRCSAARAFLIPAKNRPNLHVIKQAHVTKIEFNADKSIAGVRFAINEETELYARTRKEVILSAGAIGSPQILMNSGIGPEEHLKQMKIDVLRNAAVGQNLQDHLLVPYIVRFNKPVDHEYSMELNMKDLYEFAVNRSGLFSNVGISLLMGFISTINDPKYPDIQYHYFFIRQNDPFVRLVFELFGYRQEIVESVVEASKTGAIGIIISVLLNPKSVGKIELQSTNPFDAPKIGCEDTVYDSDDYWKCYAIQMASTLYHPTGTVKMGPDSDHDAVVDSTLQVKGVKGLRVVDASIMPKVISGNTNAPTIMIGEKASDFIKKKWMKSEHNEL